MPGELDSLRLDKWLWAARFFKTRHLAQEAIAGGKVHVNAQRVKPGKDVKPGMRISISKDNLHWELTIIALSAQRRPAKEAALLYEEDPVSRATRQQQLLDEREMRALMPHNGPDHRPNKKERRLIHRFKQDF